MKHWMRWGATFGLIGSALLGTFFGVNLPALALPEADVIQVLLQVPVFAIANEQGAPLVEAQDNGINVARVFLDQQQANAVIDVIKESRPEIGEQLRVYPKSLAEIYSFNRRTEEEEQGLYFVFVPTPEQVQAAQTIEGEFQGVPLFVGRIGPEETENRPYLLINQDGQEILPFFFEQAAINNFVDQFEETNPEEAAQVNLEVVSLENVINTLRTSDDDALRRLVLIPSSDALEYLPEILQDLQGSQEAIPEQ